MQELPTSGRVISSFIRVIFFALNDTALQRLEKKEKRVSRIHFQYFFINVIDYPLLDDDDDDDGDDDDEFFLRNGWPKKGVQPYFQPWPLSGILISINNPRAGYKPAQNLSSDFAEWSCKVMITTTPRRHKAKMHKILGFKYSS